MKDGGHVDFPEALSELPLIQNKDTSQSTNKNPPSMELCWQSLGFPHPVLEEACTGPRR